MSEMTGEQLCKKCDSFINRYIFQSRKFVWYACEQYGMPMLRSYGVVDEQFAYDYEYFTFTKSIKTLMSIRTLLHEKKNEDALILLRSIFESYLSSRFFSENSNLVHDFVFTPVLMANKIYYYDGKDQAVKDKNGKVIPYDQRQPTELKLGKDKAYFHDFYGFLCTFAHCNYSVMPCYLDKNDQFSYSEVYKPLLTRLLILFTYSKLFERIVTVEGEDFDTKKTEKDCYDLVIEVTKFLDKLFDSYIATNYNDSDKPLDKHMKEMLKAMKKSLREEVGSVAKEFLNK